MENKDKREKQQQPKEKVVTDGMVTFIKTLEYNYPYKRSPIGFQIQTESNLGYLQREILENLINLNNDDRKPYLFRVKFELESNLKYAHTTQEDLEKWYKKYKTNEKEIYDSDFSENYINTILQHQHPSEDYSFKEDANPDTIQIQREFYNFYFGKVIRDALDFIQLQIAEYSIQTTQTQTIIQKEIITNDSKKNRHSFNIAYIFKEVEKNEITQLDIYNAVEEITHNFDVQRLKILLGDFEFYLFNRKGEREAECTDKQITAEINRLKKANKEIPYLTFPILKKKPTGEFENEPEKTVVIDKEKLLYPYDFFSCYQFKNFLITEINKRVKPSEPPPKTTTSSKFHSFKYKKFNNSQDLLKQLFASLKSNNFIHKDTDLKDFKKIFSGEAIDKPIVWTGNKSELCYFIKQLATEQNKVENLKLKHWEVATICFVYPNNKAIDRDQLKGQKAPTTAKAIETIVGSL